MSEKLHRERDHVQDVVRQEFADKLIATDEENKRVKQEMAEQKSRHKLEIERMKQEVELVNKGKQEEMDAVHSRYDCSLIHISDSKVCAMHFI